MVRSKRVLEKLGFRSMLLIATMFRLPVIQEGTAFAEPLPPVPRDELKLSREQAAVYARLALRGVRQESPHHPVVSGGRIVRRPKEVHPAFYGCYDWHSAVHNHWLLVRLLKQFPDLGEGKAAREVLGSHLTEANLRVEAGYLLRPENAGFERPYGWAWALKLAEELHTWDDPQGRQWLKNLNPLTQSVVERFQNQFASQTRPDRAGMHDNTAFGLAFAHDFARVTGNARLRTLIDEQSRAYYGQDTARQRPLEPGRADFLSPCLTEVDLMRRVLPVREFQSWLRRFAPELLDGGVSPILEPVHVPQRNDAQLLHLDGLNLSRAWCFRSLANSLPVAVAARGRLLNVARRHAGTAIPHVISGDYNGEHWLPSFAVYLLTDANP